MPPLLLSNARLVLDDAILPAATLEADADGLIRDLGPGGAGRAAEDLEGDLLLPGLVELHTDAIERHFEPRPGVDWPSASAMRAHDQHMAATGVTTVLDALAIGVTDDGGARARLLTRMRDAVAAAAVDPDARASHLLHLRCEVAAPDVVELFDQAARAAPALVRLVSLMDHTVGQRQFADLATARRVYGGRFGMSDAAFDAFVAQQQERRARWAAPNRAALAAAARALGAPIASHDDGTAEQVAESAADGATIAEFPTTLLAARASQAAGMRVMIGGPNVVLGRSHSGNVAARDLAAAGAADIISSDYVPASLLEAAFALAAPEGAGLSLPRATAMASAVPAAAIGLADRGRIAPGLRADLVRVRLDAAGRPVVRAVWRAGRRVA